MQNIESTLRSLKTFDLSIAQTEEIVTAIKAIGKTGFMGITIEAGNYILRARRPERILTIKKHADELTYIKDTNKIPQISRASFEGVPFFYGCIPEQVSARIADPHDQCVIHTLYEVFDFPAEESSEEMEEYYLTMGRFSLNATILCAAITHHPDFFEKNPLSKRLHKDFEDYCQQFPDRKKDFLDVAQYLSAEFAKEVPKGKEYEYKISAAFTRVMTDHGFDGVVYPSAKGKGEGLCIAINPSRIDKLNALKLVQAVVWRIRLIKNKPRNPFMEPYLICNSILPDGRIEWQPCEIVPEHVIREYLNSRNQ